MEFNNINGSNNVFNGAKFDDRKNLPENKKVEPEKEEIKKEKSPVNPNYWQSSKGITFRGSSKQPSKTADEIADEICQEFDRTYSLTYLADDIKEAYKLRLKKAATQGEATAKQCFNYILKIGNLVDHERSENFISLVDILLDKKVELSEDDSKSAMWAMSDLTYRRNDFELQKTKFKTVLDTEGVPYQDKFIWLSRFSDDFSFKNEDEIKDSLFETSKMLSFSKDDKEKAKLLEVKLPMEYIKKINLLLEQDKISVKNLVDFHERVRSWEKSDNEDFYSTIDFLYDNAKDKGDDSCYRTFAALSDKEFISRAETGYIKEKTMSKDGFFHKAVSYFYGLSEKQKTYAFSDGKSLDSTCGTISEENFDEFKEFIEASIKSGTYLTSALYSTTRYINPATGLFDKRIQEIAKILDTKNQDSNAASSFGFEARDVAAGMIDAKTGTVDDDVMEFLDIYYFQTKPPKPDRIKNAIAKITHSYRGTPFYKNCSFFAYKLRECVEAMKDNTGSFNKKNIKYMERVMEMTNCSYGDADFAFFNASKDENGVIDRKKFKFAMQVLDITRDVRRTGEVLEEFSKLGNNAEKVFAKAVDTLGDKRVAIRNFSQFVKNCTGDDEQTKEKVAYIKSLASALKGDLNLNDRFFEAIKKPENRKIMMDLAKNYRATGHEIDGFAWTVGELKNERGVLDKSVELAVYKFATLGCPIMQLPYILRACSSAAEGDNTNLMKELNTELFDNTAKFLSTNEQLYWDLGCKAFVDAVSGEVDISSLKFKEKVQMLEAYKKIRQQPETSVLSYEVIDRIISELDRSLNNDSLFLPIEEEAKNVFVKNILGVDGAKEGEYTQFENVIKDSIPFLENSKNGLELTYPREKFLEDLTKICDSKEKLKILSKKTGMQAVIKEDGDKFTIEGYNGIIMLDSLDKNDEFESKVYDLMNRFMHHNAVVTGKPELDKELNKIIKACPEFINAIGKKQHGTHNWTLDIHMLLVLAYSIDNPDYLKLNPTDKAMLKLAAIFHDIAKQENSVDKGHQEPSSIYTRSIIKKFFNNPEGRDRVYELVKNHHWLEQYSTASDKEKLAQETAYRFRRPNDFDIAKIMAKSDLMAVSDSFYESHKDALKEENLKPIEDKLEYFYSTGSALFADYFNFKDALKSHIETKNGKEYMVVNFHNIKDNEDLRGYGFSSGKTKDDLTFLVHMVDTHRIENSLQTVKQLTSSVNGGVLSESLITPKYKRTYCDRKYGVMLSQINANVVNMNSTNQGSGFEKDFDNIMSLIYGVSNRERCNFRNALIQNLGIDKNSVSDSEFAKFYKENIISKDSYSQFRESKQYTLGGKTFNGEELVCALKKYQNSLIDKEESRHNEIVGYIPKIQAVIAKEESLQNVPDELLNFAEENNLPVVLI